MHHRSNYLPPRVANLLTPRHLLLWCVLLMAAFVGSRPSHAFARDVEFPPDSLVETVETRPFASYIVQLEAEPVAALYAALAAEGQAHAASTRALTQAHLASVDLAQQQLVATLASHEAQVLYRVQRVFNGVAIHAPVDRVAEIASLPGVQNVYPLIPKVPSNSRTAKLLNAPAIWEGSNPAALNTSGLTGRGITIAIIDTGIDYLHTTFGGPGTVGNGTGGNGTGGDTNDTTVIGDVANFPGAKVVGGYDFAGDTYDANLNSVTYQPVPVPDPDPMDCYGFGHGTHVGGTAAGYGVAMDGATYTGPYNSSIDLNGLRIGPGLAPEASLYALKVFGCTGSSNVVDAAIEWAVDPNQDGDFSDHVDVINMSLGSNFGAEFDATTIALENAASLGIIVVTSAGNAGDAHYVIGSPGVASRAIAVGATSITSEAAGDQVNLIDGALATFSSRGPRRGSHDLKPDLVAPGVNTVSARRATGNQSVTSSGTSMASPVVAGIMALLRQAHPEFGAPGWTTQELKALAMNTAVYPLLHPDSAAPYSLLRIGAGRIDPIAALQSHLIAFDQDNPELVSVSFGEVATLQTITLQTTTLVRTVRLVNKSAAPIAVTVGYTPVSQLPGVVIDVDAGKVITVPPLSSATTAVTLTVNANELQRRADPARQLVSPTAHPWIDEASGYVSFTPLESASGPPIHLPVLALPRLTTSLMALSAPIDLAASVTATFPLTLAGSAMTQVITAAAAPTQTIPLFGLFGLMHSSPPLTDLPNGDPLTDRYAHADLRYVGMAGPVTVDGEGMLYFALVTYGPWSTPLEVTYQIALDIDGDDIADFRLQNRESTDLSSVDFATTDDFVSMLEIGSTDRVVQGPLNIYPSTQFDTRPFDSNVMVLPLRLRDLGEGVKSFRYQIRSTSRDMAGEFVSSYIETTPVLYAEVGSGAGVISNFGVPLFPASTGDTIQVTFDRYAYVRQQTKGLLLLYLHNEQGTRSQTLPVQYDWFNTQHLPFIGAE